MIEDTINYKFAGKALGKAVAKQAYNLASEEVRDEYIKLFKRHIALNLTSMMQGYSNQVYAIVDSRYNQKNKTYMFMYVGLSVSICVCLWLCVLPCILGMPLNLDVEYKVFWIKKGRK